MARGRQRKALRGFLKKNDLGRSLILVRSLPRLPSPMLPELLRATFELGLPVTALSWLLFYRLYSHGELARDADRKAIKTSLKQIKKATKESQEPADSMLHAKWMKFGGGFYGTAALWTLIVNEASGVIGVIAHPSSVETMFHNGPVSLITNWVSNQISTFVQAVVWFSWWPAKGESPVIWFVIACAAYIAGLNIARYETGLGGRIVGFDSRSRWRSLIARRMGAGNGTQPIKPIATGVQGVAKDSESAAREDFKKD